jgi:hypothetical protein
MKQKCFNCKIKFEESTCAYHNRVHLKKGYPKPFCRVCKREKFIFDNPDKAKKIEEEKERRRQRRLQVKFLKEYARKFILNENWFREILDKNRKTGRINAASRRARLAKAIERLSVEELLEVKKFYNDCPSDMEVDHIIPLSKGGSHCRENLQYLSKSENVSKHDKISFSHIKKV